MTFISLDLTIAGKQAGREGGGEQERGKVCIAARHNCFCQHDPFNSKSIKALFLNFITLAIGVLMLPTNNATGK